MTVHLAVEWVSRLRGIRSGFFFEADGVPARVEVDHAVALGVVHAVGEHGGAAGLGAGGLEVVGHFVAVSDQEPLPHRQVKFERLMVAGSETELSIESSSILVLGIDKYARATNHLSGTSCATDGIGQ